ncbi:MAG: stage sporulation protein [Acidimicrobiaceae bacterium]|nr:stage sporulation protein [Acidimicrobiaceae bacterium]
MRLGRRLAVLLVALLAVGPVPAASAAVPVVVIEGKGFGHGVGMAQDGAFWMAKAGATTAQVLAHFYPGTHGAKSGGTVRVAVLQAAGPDATLAFPTGGEVRDAPSGPQSPGFPVKVPAGGQVLVHFDGSQYSVVGGTSSGGTAMRTTSGTALISSSRAMAPEQILPGETTSTTEPSPLPTLPDTTSTSTPPPPTPPTQPTPPTTSPPPESTTTTTLPPTPGGPPAPSPTTTAPPSEPTTTAPPAPPPPGAPSSPRPLWTVPSGGNGTTTSVDRGRSYRGMIEAVAAGGAIRLVNQLDVEPYLKGMGEVRDPSWPQPALQSQAIAARTYALRAMSAGGEICDDQRCQVYLGAQAEYGAMNKAVDDTAHQVLAFGSSLASTVYSANGGGFSASREEGFGATGGDFPYLQPSPYTTQNPLPWTVKVAVADVAARFGYHGTLSDVRVVQAGPSGRALTVELAGDGGPQPVNGITFAAGLGLRSTLFTLRIESADTAPPPPEPAQLIQALPDQAAATVGPPDAGALPPDIAPDLSVKPVQGTVVPGRQHHRSATGPLLSLLASILIIAVLAAMPTGRAVLAGLPWPTPVRRLPGQLRRLPGRLSRRLPGRRPGPLRPPGPLRRILRR